MPNSLLPFNIFLLVDLLARGWLILCLYNLDYYLANPIEILSRYGKEERLGQPRRVGGRHHRAIPVLPATISDYNFLWSLDMARL